MGSRPATPAAETAGEAPRGTYLDWQLDDPAGKGVDVVRPVRDEIRRRVDALLAEIDSR
ncbi:hypothetical protein [Streptomyces rubiginosohelvolus]|uniref:hypothetical protein n=1 Tax=Streptomyces rubiginosohelvolus TaxID=67362 RepID=UPI0036660196